MPTPMIPFSSRVVASPDVLFRELDGESVLLNLDTEAYLGLNEMGTRIWIAVVAAPSIQAAFETLLGEYAVAPDVLHHDIETLVGQLLEHGLVELTDA